MVETPNPDAEIARINAMTYEEMLRLWRFAPFGHRYFTGGPLGDAFERRFREMRAALSPGEHAAVSKRIGW